MPKGTDITEYSTVINRVFGGEEIVLSAPFDIGENGEFVGSLFNEFANVALEQAILGSVGFGHASGKDLQRYRFGCRGHPLCR